MSSNTFLNDSLKLIVEEVSSEKIIMEDNLLLLYFIKLQDNFFTQSDLSMLTYM